MEHKWIVRILLQRMDIGMNFNSILDYYDPHAKKLYSAFNNMKELCKRLSDPKYVSLLKMTRDQNARDIIDQNRYVSWYCSDFLLHYSNIHCVHSVKYGGHNLKSHLRSKRLCLQCYPIEHHLNHTSEILHTDITSLIRCCRQTHLPSQVWL